MQRPFAFRIFPHRKCAGLVSLWGFCTFSGSEIARMAVFGGRYSSFGDILAHFQNDKISLNVLSCEMLLHLSIFRLESPVQDTHPMAQGGTPWHQMQRDSALFPLGNTSRRNPQFMCKFCLCHARTLSSLPDSFAGRHCQTSPFSEISIA